MRELWCRAVWTARKLSSVCIAGRRKHTKSAWERNSRSTRYQTLDEKDRLTQSLIPRQRKRRPLKRPFFPSAHSRLSRAYPRVNTFPKTSTFSIVRSWRNVMLKSIRFVRVSPLCRRQLDTEMHSSGKNYTRGEKNYTQLTAREIDKLKYDVTRGLAKFINYSWIISGKLRLTN